MQPQSTLTIIKELRDLMVIEVNLMTDISTMETHNQQIANKITESRKLLDKNKRRIDELTIQLNQIEIQLAEAEKHKAVAYKIDWSNIKKSRFILEKNQRCLSVRDLVNRIKELESRTNDDDYDKQLMGTMSSTLSTKANNSIIFRRYKPYDGSEWYYGLKEWWDGDSELPRLEYQQE